MVGGLENPQFEVGMDQRLRRSFGSAGCPRDHSVPDASLKAPCCLFDAFSQKIPPFYRGPDGLTG